MASAEAEKKLVQVWLDRWLPEEKQVGNMDLQVGFKSDFPFMKEYNENVKRLRKEGKIAYGISSINGCAKQHLGKAWVFIDGIVNDENIGLIDLCECCWHCKNAKEEKEGNTSTYSCLLHFDNWTEAYIADINRVVVHELVHLCGLGEKKTTIATAKAVSRWTPCSKFIDKGA